MEITDVQLAAAFRLAIAGLIGLGVGLEREWSGHAVGPEARFAGLRTFLLLGLVGGTAGLLAREGHENLASVIVTGAALFAVAAYVMFVRQPGSNRDGTTEVAAILVVALGVLAGAVSWLIAAGAGSVMVLALNEKKRLHGAVSNLDSEELRAALQFAVLALVVLPLLPEGPYFGLAAIRPRMLWVIVLLFCALNFAGFVARRSTGRGRGYLLTGMFGGVISSTAVTVGFARYSRKYPEAAGGLAAGVVGACTILVPRVLVISLLLNQSVAIALLPFVLPAALIGVTVLALAWRFGGAWEANSQVAEPMAWLAAKEKNPLRLWFAIQLALVFQVAMIAVTFVRQMWSVQGLYGSAVVLGLTDVDALTVSMSTPSTNLLVSDAAHAIAIGILANTVVKLGISAVMGAPRYRLIAAGVLIAMAVSIAITLAVF